MVKITTLSTLASLYFLVPLSTAAFSETINKDFIKDDNLPPTVIIIPRPENIVGIHANEATGLVTAVSEDLNPAGIPYVMGQIDFGAEVVDPETGEILCRIGDYFQNHE